MALLRADMEFSLAEKGETAGGAPPLPLSEHIVLPQPKTIFSLRRQAKFHTAGISFADSGKFHSPKANFTVQPAAGRGCTTGDREAVKGAHGRKAT